MARLAAAALSFALLLGAGTPPAQGAPERPLLGLVGEDSLTLARIDRRTLLPVPGSALRVGSVGSWSFSPDRSHLALVTIGPPGSCPRSSLRFFDATTLRPSGRLALPGGGAIEGLTWLRRDRVLAVRLACEGSAHSFVVIDPIARRVVRRVPVDGELVRVVPTAAGIVALAAPEHAIAPAHLLVVDPEGAVRSRMVEQLPAGSEPGPREIGHYARPALAVGADRAFVLSAAGLVAEIDLETLAVRYHALRQRSLSKASEGWSRHALWLGNGLLAVSGKDAEAWTTPEGVLNMRDRPAGVFVVDTSSWRVRAIDPDGDFFEFVDQLLYVTRYSWDSSTRATTAIGVAAYGLDGVQRFHVAPRRVAYLALVHRGRAYVGFDFRGGPYLVVDVASGRTVERRTAALPSLLRGQAAPYWRNGY